MTVQQAWRALAIEAVFIVALILIKPWQTLFRLGQVVARRVTRRRA